MCRHVHDAHVTGNALGWRLELAHRGSELLEVPEADRALFETHIAAASGAFAYVTDPHGALVTLEGWDAASQRAGGAFDALIATLPPPLQGAVTGAKAAMTPAAFEADARSKWWWGGLDGEKFKPGKPVVSATQTPVGPTSVPSVATTTLTTGTPCTDGGPPKCVTVVFTVTPDADATTAAFRAMMPTPVSVSVTSTTTLVVEPDKLRPWRVASEGGTEVTLPDGRPVRSQHKVVDMTCPS